MLKNTPQSQCGSVKKLFSSESGFDERIARLIVLYEDLRLETSGLTEETIPALELIEGSSASSSRVLYFLRRATVTLAEFCSAMCDLNGCGEFKSFKKRSALIPGTDWNPWDDAVKGLEQIRKLENLKEVRDRTGAHFPRDKAARLAISTLNSKYPDLDYTIEVTAYPTPGKMDYKFHFAVHLVAAATVGELEGAEAKDKVEKLVRTIVSAQGYACKAMDQLTAHYLLDRFDEPAPQAPG